jgi:ribosomal protein L4
MDFIGALGVEGKVLLLTDGNKEPIHLSARNVATLNVLPFGEESVYDVLWAETVVIERSALEQRPRAKADEAVEEPQAMDAEAADPETDAGEDSDE